MSGLIAKITGFISGNTAEVDSNNCLLVNLPQDVSKAGFTLVGGLTPGVNNTAEYRPIYVTEEGRQKAALDRPVFYVNFAGSATAANAIPQDALKQTATTMTVSAGSTAGGFLWLNSGLSVAATVGIAYQTYTTFATYGGYETVYEFVGMPINCNTAVNKVLELGIGLITSATSIGLLDGICFRWTAAGTFIGVCSINGAEYQTNPLTVPSDNVVHRFTIRLNNDGAEFFVDGVMQADLAPPTALPSLCYQPNLPLLVRVYNMAATPSLPPQFKLAEMWVGQNEADWQKPWPHIVAGMSQHAANVPFGSVIGESATNYLNSTAIPAAAAASNTAALVTGLGGHFQMNAQAGSLLAATDNIVTSYQIPVQSATQASKRFICTGMRITGINTGAVVATTPTTILWGVAWGHTAVSLATADAVNAKAPRHTKVGTQSWAVGAVIGQNANDINVTFSTPFTVNPGEFIASTARFIVGTATASQVITGSVSFDGYWE